MEDIVIIYTIIFLIIMIILWLVFRKVSINYVRKNKSKLIEINKLLYTQCEKNGKNVQKFDKMYKEYIKKLKLNSVYCCSNSIVANASINETKYLIKYSKIDYSQECLEKIEFCKNYMELHNLFYINMMELSREIYKKMPIYIRIFINWKKISFMLLNISWKLRKLTMYTFEFSYTSPAGRSHTSHKILISKEILEDLKKEISGKISKTGFSKSQRNLMTNDLREKVKRRDNYTCCICGNSIEKEPNLLLEVDHIIPVSKGGKTEINNLQTLCWRCNRAKGIDKISHL